MNILVVDDEKYWMDLLCMEIMRIDSHKIFKASSLMEAKKIIDEETINFIVSDLNLPELNLGVEVLRYSKLKNINSLLIFISVQASLGREEAIKLGAIDLLNKKSGKIFWEELNKNITNAFELLRQKDIESEKFVNIEPFTRKIDTALCRLNPAILFFLNNLFINKINIDTIGSVINSYNDVNIKSFPESYTLNKNNVYNVFSAKDPYGIGYLIHAININI